MRYEKVFLSEVCDLVPGYAFRGKDFGDFKDKVIKITHITPPTVDMDNLVGIDIDKYDISKLKKFIAQKGDYVLAMTGATIGKIGRVERGCAYVNQRVLLFKNKNCVDKNYLYYVLKQKEFEQYVFNHIDSNSAQPNISASTIGNFSFDLPDLVFQKKIGNGLRLLDEKIAINREINDNLQQQAAALFSSLYDRSNTEVRFTDLIQILGGGTPKTGENTYWNGNIAFFTPKDVGIPYTLITEKTISKEGLSHCNSRLYPVNTVFVTARGTVGKVGMSGVPMAMNQSCYALVGKETHQLLVYFYTLKAVDRLKHKASGAVFDAITTRDFESEQIMKLSDDDAKAFLCVAEPMFQEVLNNNIENLRLSTLRDSLLPKLMSGEIDVSVVQF